MRSVILALAGILCSVLWLELLVVTHFNQVTVCIGLLIVLYATGSSATTRSNTVRKHRLY